MEIPFAAVAPLLLLAVAFVAYCLVDLSRTSEVRGLPRWAWAIVVVISVPIGGLIYLLAGRRT